MKRKNSFPFETLTGLLLFLLLWELLYLVIQHPVVPEPAATLLLFLQSFPVLLPHIFSSFYRICVAILLSLLISVPAGLWIGTSRWANRVLSPLLYLVYPIPKVAFLPVFMVLYGLGDTSKIFLMIWIIVFQLILSVRDGIAQIDPAYYQVMKMLHATKRQQFRYLLLPAIVPQVLGGLRICIGIAAASLFFAENYATTYGLGYYIMNAWSVIDYQEMFCGILALSMLGLGLFKLIDALERLLVSWKKTAGIETNSGSF